jgi:hypothetical protein
MLRLRARQQYKSDRATQVKIIDSFTVLRQHRAARVLVFPGSMMHLISLELVIAKI